MPHHGFMAGTTRSSVHGAAASGVPMTTLEVSSTVRKDSVAPGEPAVPASSSEVSNSGGKRARDDEANTVLQIIAEGRQIGNYDPYLIGVHPPSVSCDDESASVSSSRVILPEAGSNAPAAAAAPASHLCGRCRGFSPTWGRRWSPFSRRSRLCMVTLWTAWSVA